MVESETITAVLKKARGKARTAPMRNVNKIHVQVDVLSGKSGGITGKLLANEILLRQVLCFQKGPIKTGKARWQHTRLREFA
jgi:hypothetical protein